MPNTYTQIYVHVVFAVRGRAPLINETWKNSLYGYISGIVKAKGQKMLIINGMPDHVHLLLGLKPDCNLSELIRDVKTNSTRWINENRYSNVYFQWQTGFGGFSLGQSQLEKTISYIINQEKHHKKIPFREELKSFLKAYNVEYRNEYLFDD